MSGGEYSVSNCVPGRLVEDLVLSDGLVIVLVNPRGCCLTRDLEVEG